MMNAGNMNDPKPTSANAVSRIQSDRERAISEFMEEEIEFPQLDGREFYRISSGSFIAGKYYPIVPKEMPQSFSPLEEEQDRGRFTSTRFTAE